jgi:hypothetical protein
VVSDNPVPSCREREAPEPRCDWPASSLVPSGSRPSGAGWVRPTPAHGSHGSGIQHFLHCAKWLQG